MSFGSFGKGVSSLMPPAVGGRGFARHVVFAGRVSRPKAAGVPESAPASTPPELDEDDPPEDEDDDEEDDDDDVPDEDELEDDEEELEAPTAGAVSSFPQAAAIPSVTPSVTSPIRRSIERG